MSTPHTDYLLVEIDAVKIADGTTETLYFSTFGYASWPSDTPANEPYYGRMLGRFQIERSISSGTRIGGASMSAYGAIRLDNKDRGCDHWRSTYSFCGRPVRVLQLDGPKKPLSTATTRFVGRVSGEPKVGVEEAVLQVKDIKSLLDTEVRLPIYSGGEDGLKFQSSGAGKAIIASAGEMELDGDLAVMARIYVTSAGTGVVVGWDAVEYPWRLAILSSGGLRLRFTIGGTAKNVDTTSTSMWAVNTWYTVGCVVNTNEVRFFSRNMEDRNQGITWETVTSSFLLSRDGVDTPTGFGIAALGTFDGYAPEVRVWDGAGNTDYRRWIEMRIWPNSISETDALYPAYGNLVGYWKSDEGTGTTLYDATSSGNDLTLSGSYTWDYKALGGGEDLAGKNKPLALGTRYRIRPVLLSATKSLHQISCTSINAWLRLVQNGGSIAAENVGGSWTDGGDTSVGGPYLNNAPDFSTFMSHTVALGSYIVYNPLGLMRTAANVDDGGLRADVDGYNNYQGLGLFFDDVDELITILADEFGPLSNSDIDMSANSFSADVHGKPAGLYVPSGSNRKISQYIDDLVMPRGAWGEDRNTGKLVANLISAADGTGTVHEITAAHLSDRSPPIEVKPSAGPTRGYRVGYAKTEDNLNEDAIAATVSAADRDLYAESYRWILVEEDSVASIYLGAQDVQEVGSPYAHRKSAYQEAIAMQTFKGDGTRNPHVFHLVQEPGVIDIGHELYFPEAVLNIAAGTRMLVVGFSETNMTVEAI